MFYARPDLYGQSVGVCSCSKSIQLLLAQDWQANIQHIEQQLSTLYVLDGHPVVKDVRVLGAIGVVELHQAVNLAEFQAECSSWCMDSSIWQTGVCHATFYYFYSRIADIAGTYDRYDSAPGACSMNHLEHFAQQLDVLKQQGQYREFKSNITSAAHFELNGKTC